MLQLYDLTRRNVKEVRPDEATFALLLHCAIAFPPQLLKEAYRLVVDDLRKHLSYRERSGQIYRLLLTLTGRVGDMKELEATYREAKGKFERKMMSANEWDKVETAYREGGGFALGAYGDEEGLSQIL